MKKWKRVLLWICCVLMVCGNLISIMAVEDEEDTTEEVKIARLALAGTTTPTGEIGKDMNVKITIQNIGTGDARNVTISPKLTDKDCPFEPKNMGFQSVGRIADGKSTEVSFTYRVKEKVVTGYYGISYDILYYEEDGTQPLTATLLSYVYINGVTEDETTTEETKAADINISLRNSKKPAAAVHGGDIEFDLVLTNYGEDDAYNVTIEPVISEDSGKYPFEIEMASYQQPLPSVLLGTKSQPTEGARTQTVHYAMTVRDDVKTQYYPISFHIVAVNKDGNKVETDQTIYFDITGKPEESTTEFNPETTTKSTFPRLMVTGYEKDVEKIIAGQPFTLTIHIQNTSDEKDVQNLKFTISSTDDAFLPVSGSNTMFIRHMAIGETTDLVIKLTPKSDLAAKTYSITLESEYEDTNLNAYTGKESLSISVSQQLRISIGEVDAEPASIEVGAQSNIMFGINNLGKSKIYNVNVSFLGDSINGGETFKGNIDSGATANVDVMVNGIAVTADEGIIKAIVSYEDENGEVYTAEKEFTLYVTEPFIPDDGGWTTDVMDPNIEPEKKKPSWIIPAAIGAAVGIGVIIVVVVKRKRRKKLEEGMEDNEGI